jgi:hypothetical protein
MIRAARAAVVVTAVVTVVAWSAPAPAAAASPAGVLCTLTGLVSGVVGKVCGLATHAGNVVGAGRQLLGGHVGGAIGALTGGNAPRAAAATVGLAAIATAVVGGARYLLKATARVVGATTRPNLTSTWFSAAYWRMAAIATLLTLPFLFAAAVHALIRSDLALLARAAFGYLPLALLGVGVAAPLTMLLLSASDEMSALVASASGHAGATFLDRAGGLGGGVGLFGGDLFVSFFVALLTAAATIALWAELLIRDAAVYVVVLMLPLFFAAMVWPARRIWAVRAVELLVALILSKFVIVAVLTLGGAALGHTLVPGPASVLTGMTLVMLAAFSPWALMRLLPLQELAAAAAGGLRGGGLRNLPDRLGDADRASDAVQAPSPLDPHVSLAGEADVDDTAGVASAGSADMDDTSQVASAGAADMDDTSQVASAGAADMDDTSQVASPASPPTGPPGEPTPDHTQTKPARPFTVHFQEGTEWRAMHLGRRGAYEDMSSDEPLVSAPEDEE